jgi:BRO1-like domain-containing protein
MISCPLKQTNEIDWVRPLKDYIQQSYGDDPERYQEECNTLHRLRQDMRGAGKDSASGRDLLYRYYGQLELLDLRFPVDENHIKISFTWYVYLGPVTGMMVDRMDISISVYRQNMS